jgi:hypothetical protein
MDSLLDQTPLAPSRVILAVPNVVRGSAIDEADLQWTSDEKYHDRLVVHRMDHDFGPATKLMGCLEVIPEDEDVCLVVTDDDMVRPQQFVQLLLHQHSCTAGSHRIAGGFDDGPAGDTTYEHMVHGYRGFAVHRSSVSFDKLHTFSQKHKDACFYVDDEMLTGYFRSQCLAIDTLYSDDARHVPEIRKLISDDSMHNDHGHYHGLSASSLTGGAKMASACREAVESDEKHACN